jgi:hypothetical protein
VEIQTYATKHGFRPENKTVTLDPDIFNLDHGIEYEVPCRLLRAPVDAEVLWHVTALWLVCKAGG